ncbi:solute carrier organic anion transporter family member 4A1-like isoform X2 [Dendronephthya gigantea]|nr:solute carrier organic anion transporter family member 4A1-like isoform X2 [Dendronephthya gigantea]XP_028411538.1 solute carrier organic anion transporter family member 4A1-like isoform X2 [Dendronephthya gigantea]XP_028411546.1 solute carrier organic anion transporter family member 4A1-like isoform X2 [Dendronephthya gigantea]
MDEKENLDEKEVAPFIENSDEEKSSELKFGWGKFRPKCLQIFNGPKCFLFILIFYTISQALVVLGLTTLTLPSIEKRFSLTSKELGVIMASNDVTALIVVIFIGFYGDYGNKIRWIGGGGILLSISTLLYVLPHFMIGAYQPSLTGPRGPSCFSGNITQSLGQGKCSLESDSRWYYMAIFVLSQLIMGAGTSPFYSLVPAYLDENVHPKHMPLYLGAWTFATFLGPGLGMIIGGKFLSIYVDLEQPEGVNLTSRDPRWIGAWWLGFVIFGIVIFVFSLLILGFPRELPGAKKKREEHIKKGNIRRTKIDRKPSLRIIIPELKDLLTNWTFLFNTLGLTATLLYVGALMPFIPKILMLKFGLLPEQIGYILGSLMTPSMAVGITIGTLVLKRFSLKDVCKKSALFIFILRTLGFISPLSFLITGCNNINLAGVTTPYREINTEHIRQPISSSKLSLTATCNMNCKCSRSRFSPICGSDNITYFDMCHAGCKIRFPNMTFANCSCIRGSQSSKLGTARFGICDNDCKNFIFFVLLLGLNIAIQFVKMVPDKTVTLRCVPDNKRAFANGIQYVFMKTLGLLPGPILFGHVVDSYCTVWQDTCGVKGRCFDYNIDYLSYAVCVLGVILTFLSALFYFLSWYFYKPEESDCENVIKDPEAFQNGKETKL